MSGVLINDEQTAFSFCDNICPQNLADHAHLLEKWIAVYRAVLYNIIPDL